MSRIFVLLIVLIFAVAQNDADQIKMAIADYVEGIYEVDGSRIERSIDPTLRKYGFGYNQKEKRYYNGSEMNYKQLVRLANSWNKDNKRVDPKTAKKEISILDQLDKTASAKLVAYWGVDYFHLIKEEGKWKIVNVVWQSLPKE